MQVTFADSTVDWILYGSFHINMLALRYKRSITLENYSLTLGCLVELESPQ